VEPGQQAGRAELDEAARVRSSLGADGGPKRKLFVDLGETMFRKTAGANGAQGRSTASVPDSRR